MEPKCPPDHHIVVSCVKNKTLKTKKGDKKNKSLKNRNTLKTNQLVQKPTLNKNAKINKTIKKTYASTNKTLKKKCKTLQSSNTNMLSSNPTKKELQSYLNMKSYSPTVNKLISVKSITPHKDIFEGICKEEQIYVTTGKDKGKCYKWTSKKAKNYLLDNLKSNKTFNAKELLGPQQNLSNCWFNTFFIIFFISDKGRKFTKSFREGMINGEIKSKDGTINKIPNKIKYPLWLLNKFITATLLGKNDKTLFASKMNTNDIITKIYSGIPKKYKIRLDSIKNEGEAGNPIYYYLDIISWLNMNNIGQKYPIHYTVIFKWSELNDLNNYSSSSKKDTEIIKYIKENKPHVIAISSSDNFINNGMTDKGVLATPEDMKKKLEYKIGNMVYKLDSVVVRDVKKNHMSGLLTLNGEEYMFDGENTKSPLMKKKWLKYFNKNKNFKITSSISEKYNFLKGYSCNIYYRVK